MPKNVRHFMKWRKAIHVMPKLCRQYVYCLKFTSRQFMYCLSVSKEQKEVLQISFYLYSVTSLVHEEIKCRRAILWPHN